MHIYPSSTRFVTHTDARQASRTDTKQVGGMFVCRSPKPEEGDGQRSSTRPETKLKAAGHILNSRDSGVEKN